ncbi:MAG: hypothetical protein K0R09_1041 [Clostridiales bacterium]|nr:hypothetical protein [Clostridiales bacterium]
MLIKLKLEDMKYIIIIFALIGLFAGILSIDYRKSIESFYITDQYERITSIQYSEKKETYGIGDGKNIESNKITYVFPDKLRIESSGKSRSVEIYKYDTYLYYDFNSSHIKSKECFPPEEPYITEIEKKMINILKSGEYEFLGYEEKDSKRLEIIGVRSKADGHSYMHKLWITEINKVVLPHIEEYFIDNVVVSKSSFEYFNVNEPVNPNVFSIESLPQLQVVDDGVLSKHMETFKEAQKYMNFKLILPEQLPIGLIPSEIGVVPPVKKPSFYCIYFKEGYRIYLNEKGEKIQIKPNSALGKFPAEFMIEDEKALLSWNQNNISITLTGDEAILKYIINLAEQISGEKLVKNDNIN